MNLRTKVKVLPNRKRSFKSLLKEGPDAVFNLHFGHLKEFCETQQSITTLCILIRLLPFSIRFFSGSQKYPYLHRIYKTMAVFTCFWQLSRCTLVVGLRLYLPEYNCMYLKITCKNVVSFFP